MDAQALQALSHFYDYLQTERRLSRHTISGYQHDLMLLVQFCDNQHITDWQAIGVVDIRSHIGSRHRQGMNGKSLQRELSAIRSLYQFLLRRYGVTNNPAKQVKAPKQGRKLPKTLDVDQVTGLLEAGTDSVLEIRDLAIFELGYSSGLRLSELTALDITDLDLHTGSLMVKHGKGNKSRFLPVGKKAIQALQHWLAHRMIATPDELAVFTSKYGKRLTQRSLQLRLEHWCKKKRYHRTCSPPHA